MSKPLGTSKLKLRQAPNTEWGLWRMNEDGCIYLLLTSPDIDEIAEMGKKFGRILNLPMEVDKSDYYGE